MLLVDATEHDPSIGGRTNCRSNTPVYLPFLYDRYGRGKTDRQKARIWNGGPDGHLQDVTLNYAALEYD